MAARSPALALQGRRAAELAAIFMIGDGALGLVQPDRHVALWQSPRLDALVGPFAGRSTARRLYGAGQIVAGLLLAAALRPD